MYWYNYGIKNGREYISGPYSSEDKAHEVGFQVYDGGNFQSYDLSTRNFNEAVRRIRHIRLEGGESLEKACARKGRIEEDLEVGSGGQP